MQARNDNADLTDLADGTLAGAEWDAWLLAHPDMADEVAIARRVRILVGELRAASIELPADFEARLLERVREDTTLLELLELGFAGIGRALIELLEALFGLAPSPTVGLA